MNKSRSPKNISNIVIKGMQEKKAKDIVILDLRKIPNMFTNYMLLCTANTNIHAEAISDGITEEVVNHVGNKPYGVEGLMKKEWILMDYIDLVVHIFLEKQRERYSLESYWGDAIIKRLDNNENHDK